MTLKERIQGLCKEKKIPVSKLESDLGFGGGYVSKMDKSTPTTAKIQAISEYLNVSIDYLLNGKNNRFSDENAHLIAKIRNDAELTEALKKYFEFSDVKKNHVIELINLLNE